MPRHTRISRHVVSTGAALLLATVMGTSPIAVDQPSAAVADACDISKPGVRFFCTTPDGRGFTTTDTGPRRLLELYTHLGGDAVLGPVRSQPFRSKRFPGFWFVATERYVFQLREGGDATVERDGGFTNTLDLASDAGHPEWDTILLERYGIPKPREWPAGRPGMTPEDVNREHMETVFGQRYDDPNAQRASDGFYDVLTSRGHYTTMGLPMSGIERVKRQGVTGYAVRLQRGALFRRDDNGVIEPILAGAELLKQVGFMDPETQSALEPAPPPGDPRIEIQLPERADLYEPLVFPLGLFCGLRVPTIDCGPDTLTGRVVVFEQGIRGANGRAPLVSAEGLVLRGEIRDVATNTELVKIDQPVGADGQVVLPPITSDRDRVVELVARLDGQYLGVPVVPSDGRARSTLRYIPAHKTFGIPTAFAAVAALLGGMVLLVAAVLRANAFLRHRASLGLPFATITVGGNPRSLATYTDAEVRWTRWLLGMPSIDGAAVGAPGLRFAIDGRGEIHVAGHGRTAEGRPLGWLTGTPVVDGARIITRSGVEVVIGDHASATHPQAAPTLVKTGAVRRRPAGLASPAGGPRPAGLGMGRAGGLARSSGLRAGGRPRRPGSGLGGIR